MWFPRSPQNFNLLHCHINIGSDTLLNFPLRVNTVWKVEKIFLQENLTSMKRHREDSFHKNKQKNKTNKKKRTAKETRPCPNIIVSATYKAIERADNKCLDTAKLEIFKE